MTKTHPGKQSWDFCLDLEKEEELSLPWPADWKAMLSPEVLGQGTESSLPGERLVLVGAEHWDGERLLVPTSLWNPGI